MTLLKTFFSLPRFIISFCDAFFVPIMVEKNKDRWIFLSVWFERKSFYSNRSRYFGSGHSCLLPIQCSRPKNATVKLKRRENDRRALDKSALLFPTPPYAPPHAMNHADGNGICVMSSSMNDTFEGKKAQGRREHEQRCQLIRYWLVVPIVISIFCAFSGLLSRHRYAASEWVSNLTQIPPNVLRFTRNQK